MGWRRPPVRAGAGRRGCPSVPGPRAKKNRRVARAAEKKRSAARCFEQARRLLEAEPCAEAEAPRAHHLVDESRGGRHRGRAVRELPLPLQDECLVEDVEAVGSQGQAEVLEGELLLDAKIEIDDVVEPVAVRGADLDDLAAGARAGDAELARAEVDPERIGIP